MLSFWKWYTSLQTQNICITFIQCRPNVFDVGPTLYKCHTNVLCLMGYRYLWTICVRSLDTSEAIQQVLHSGQICAPPGAAIWQLPASTKLNEWVPSKHETPIQCLDYSPNSPNIESTSSAGCYNYGINSFFVIPIFLRSKVSILISFYI